MLSGLPRQFMEMKLKRRCSILFHLLVPGGMSPTVMTRPIVAASLASSTLKARERVAVRPAGIGGDHEPGGLGIAGLAHPLPPPGDGGYGEGRGVVGRRLR